MGSLIILVFIEIQDPGVSLPAVLERSAQEALGPRASVSVRSIRADTPDDLLVRLGQEQGAWAVARVVWGDHQQLGARLDVTLMESHPRKVSQPLSFVGSDPPGERWRALGLVLASTLVKDAAAQGGESGPQLVAGAPSPPPPPPPPLAPPRWALDAAAEAAFPIGGAGTRAGGTIGVRWLALDRVGFRFGLRGRFGQMQEAQAAIVTLAATAGAILALVQPRADQPFGLALRGDAMVIYETLSHLSPDDAARVRQGRVLPGGSVVVELSWSLSPSLALLLAAGPEVAWGTPRVYVGQTEVGHLSPLRGAVQGGLTSSF